MPKVGGKQYSYSKSGRKAARAESRKTGKPVVVKKTLKKPAKK